MEYWKENPSLTWGGIQAPAQGSGEQPFRRTPGRGLGAHGMGTPEAGGLPCGCRAGRRDHGRARISRDSEAYRNARELARQSCPGKASRNVTVPDRASWKRPMWGDKSRYRAIAGPRAWSSICTLRKAVDYYLDPDSIYTKQLRQRGELLTHDKDQSVFVFLKLDDLMGDRFPAHQGEISHWATSCTSSRRHAATLFPVIDNFGHLLGGRPAGRPARGHVQTRKIRAPDLRLHDPAPGQNPRTRVDTGCHGEIRGQAYPGCCPWSTNKTATWASFPNRAS